MWTYRSAPARGGEIPAPGAPAGVLDPVPRTAPRAKTHERKKRRLRQIVALESGSPLRRFFTGGVEYDDRVDLIAISRFIDDFASFARALEVPRAWGQGVQIKFRRLGRHRADGLYYPEQAVLALDLKSMLSFAHEFGHLIDYRSAVADAPGSEALPLSRREGFQAVHALFVERIDARVEGDPRLAKRTGRLTRGYFASPAECFARGFEQFVAEALEEPSVLVAERKKYRDDPLFLEDPPPFLFDYYRRAIEGRSEDPDPELYLEAYEPWP
jgi:hypothetical protein